jgi:hypothetical protein
MTTRSSHTKVYGTKVCYIVSFGGFLALLKYPMTHHLQFSSDTELQAQLEPWNLGMDMSVDEAGGSVARRASVIVAPAGTSPPTEVIVWPSITTVFAPRTFSPSKIRT